MRNFIYKYYQLNIWLICLVLIMIYIVSLLYEFTYLFTDEFYFKVLPNIDTKEIAEFIIKDREQNWINFLLIPIIILLPAFLISLPIFIGTIFENIKVKYRDVFSFTLKSQIVFAVNYFVTVILKSLGVVECNMQTVNNNYYYQSARIFFKDSEIPYWAIYPLQYINIAEILYFIFLTLGVKQMLGYNTKEGIKFMLSYYCLGVFLWILFVVFLLSI